MWDIIVVRNSSQYEYITGYPIKNVLLSTIVENKWFQVLKVLTMVLLAAALVAEATLFEDEAKMFVLPILAVLFFMNGMEIKKKIDEWINYMDKQKKK